MPQEVEVTYGTLMDNLAKQANMQSIGCMLLRQQSTRSKCRATDKVGNGGGPFSCGLCHLLRGWRLYRSAETFWSLLGHHLVSDWTTFVLNHLFGRDISVPETSREAFVTFRDPPKTP